MPLTTQLGMVNTPPIKIVIFGGMVHYCVTNISGLMENLWMKWEIIGNQSGNIFELDERKHRENRNLDFNFGRTDFRFL